MTECFGSGTTMTLGEAIQALRASESEGDMTNKVTMDVARLLEQHDAIHILFNCGTSIEDEIAAHVWMIFATTAKLSEMHRAVADQEHRNVLTKVGHLKLLSTWFTCLPRIIGIILKSLRMKKLPIEQLSQLKEQTVLAIRQNYGITL